MIRQPYKIEKDYSEGQDSNTLELNACTQPGYDMTLQGNAKMQYAIWAHWMWGSVYTCSSLECYCW